MICDMRYDKAKLSSSARLALHEYEICKKHGQIRSDYAIEFIECVMDPNRGSEPGYKKPFILKRMYWKLRYR